MQMYEMQGNTLVASTHKFAKVSIQMCVSVQLYLQDVCIQKNTLAASTHKVAQARMAPPHELVPTFYQSLKQQYVVGVICRRTSAAVLHQPREHLHARLSHCRSPL